VLQWFAFANGFFQSLPQIPIISVQKIEKFVAYSDLMFWLLPQPFYFFPGNVSGFLVETIFLVCVFFLPQRAQREDFF
jgi:hypothetical protein